MRSLDLKESVMESLVSRYFWHRPMIRVQTSAQLPYLALLLLSWRLTRNLCTSSMKLFVWIKCPLPKRPLLITVEKMEHQWEL